jgi:hypothetical protein
MRSIPANRRSITATGINALTSWFKPSDRHEEPPNGRHSVRRTEKEEGIEMKKFGFATIAASGLAAAILGFAGPAQAGIDHHDWLHDIQPQVSVPHVDTSVQQSR